MDVSSPGLRVFVSQWLYLIYLGIFSTSHSMQPRIVIQNILRKNEYNAKWSSVQFAYHLKKGLSRAKAY